MRTLNLASLYIAVLIVPAVHAQITDFPNYQQQIQKAEIKLVNGQQKQALDIYYNVLTRWDGNFAKDIYNALVAAQQLNRLDTFFTLLDLVKYKNFSNGYLQELEAFKPLHTDSRWTAFISNNNKVIYIDTALRRRINNLYDADQYFRQKDGAYKLYGDTIRKIDSTNIKYLLGLIVQRGLPGEKEIGAQDFSGNQAYYIVLHHHTQGRSQNRNLINMTPMLIRQVQMGRVPPNKCAYWLEMQNGEFRAGVFDIIRASFNDSMSGGLVRRYTPEQKLVIEEYRKWICLEPLSEYHQKVKYSINHWYNNPYRFDVPISIFELPTQKDYDAYLRSWDPIN